MKAHTPLLALLLLAAPVRGAEAAEPIDSPFFVEGPDWQESLLSSRTRYLEQRQDDEILLEPWFATAPLQAQSFDEALPPEQQIDLSAVDAQGNPLWTRRPAWIDGKVHNLPQVNHASTYLYRTIRATAPVSLRAGLGSDDGIVVWLNGEKLLSKDVPRGAAPNQDRATLNLIEGENRLLLKIHNISGGHGFFFQLKQDPRVTLWEHFAREYPDTAADLRLDLADGTHLDLFADDEAMVDTGRAILALLDNVGIGAGDLRESHAALVDEGAARSDRRWFDQYQRLRLIRSHLNDYRALDLDALTRAVEDLAATWPPEQYDRRNLEMLYAVRQRALIVEEELLAGDLSRAAGALRTVTWMKGMRRKMLLSNPLIDFDRLMLIRRTANSPRLGLPQNWQGNCSLPRKGYDDQLCTLELRAGDAKAEPFFQPESSRMIADIDLHWDADRILFSMIGSHDRWQIFELKFDGMKLRQVTPGEFDDVDNYDACYIPDGRIIFDSTRCFQGIPCVGGADAVANLFILDEANGSTRQLCFDQDHNWCPTVLNNGRVLFTRWEYSDTPHYFTRLLMHMNPDGTGQMEYYGSNSFWPNSIFFARPVPDHPTQVVGIVSGHHGVPRMGELVLFDPALGRFEADGVVQRIPGFGEEVEPVIVDRLVDKSWPRFLHPVPLSSKYFLVSCQPDAKSPWGIYLVDVFDNKVLLAEERGFALLEPVPLKKTPRPPAIPDRVKPEASDATVFLADIYRGPGLEGVPRGTVKKLRLYAFHYGYNNMGGHAHVGIEGPWDIHRLLGTVPVHEDGSAGFTIPANTPIALQPLDEEGKAVQLMRSWFTAMPGEVLSCVGCHEPQNMANPVAATMAARMAPSAVEPWYGPTRGFSFTREVQPVLDRHCVGCHDGVSEGAVEPDLSRKSEQGWNNFTPSYLALHPYVRRPGPESDYHLLEPLEFHANTSELIQMLQKGHHGVRLDDEAWDRLVTWIDLNVPDHGTWSEHREIPREGRERRCEMQARYAGITVDPEEIPIADAAPVEFIRPEPVPIVQEDLPAIDGWPFDGNQARKLQQDAGEPTELALELGDGVTLDLRLVPAGQFVMGATDGFADEAPRSVTRIDRPFYMGTTEVTCAQYARFDPDHFNGYHDQRHKDHTRPGYTAHAPDRPVIRISWQEAMAFCEWLSQETGHRCTLPTEGEWEWACRAGADTPFSYGDLDTDFAPFANLADASTRKLAVTGVDPAPIANPNEYQDYLPKEARFDDGNRLMADVGQFRPNRWGLFDLHGNVCEWTLSDYRPYPYVADDGRNEMSMKARKAVRGGSWRDRPKLARSSWRFGYRPYQRVYNVGFRVVIHP